MATVEQQHAFINAMITQGQKGYHDYGVLASVTIAQGAWESGWGLSPLAQNDHNLFGIKFAGNHDTSISVTQGTQPSDGTGGYYCHYESWGDSSLDHGYFLKHNSRYSALFSQTTPQGQLNAIWQAGYAQEADGSLTANYVENIMSIINANNLTQYDTGGAPPDDPPVDPPVDPPTDTYGDDYATVYASYFTKYDDLSAVYKKLITTPYIMNQLSADFITFIKTLNFNDSVSMKYTYNHNKRQVGKNYLGNRLTIDAKEYIIKEVRSDGLIVISNGGSVCYDYLNVKYITQNDTQKASTKSVNVAKIKQHKIDEKKEVTP